jgi:hypothetical protein
LDLATGAVALQIFESARKAFAGTLASQPRVDLIRFDFTLRSRQRAGFES